MPTWKSVKLEVVNLISNPERGHMASNHVVAGSTPAPPTLLNKHQQNARKCFNHLDHLHDALNKGCKSLLNSAHRKTPDFMGFGNNLPRKVAKKCHCTRVHECPVYGALRVFLWGGRWLGHRKCGFKNVACSNLLGSQTSPHF